MRNVTFHPVRFAVAAMLGLLLSGCATRLYDRKGQLGFETYADATNIHVRLADGTRLDADTLNHSAPTSAALGGATGLATAVGGVIATNRVIH